MSALLFAGEIIAAATLILLVTHMLAALIARASLRHLVRLGALAALLLLPLAALLPSLFVLSEPSVVMTDAPPDADVTAWLLTGFAALWAAGVIVLLARGLVGAFALGRLGRHARAHDFDPQTLASWAAQAGYAGDWRLRFSAAIQTPLSWGIVRPIILLPEECAYWEPAARDAAMLHELAHLRRRDAAAQILALICRALYWPHPLVWLQTRALSADAEKSADDAVIVSGVRQSDYAQLLLHVAAGGRQCFTGLEAAMAARAGLEQRIQSVLAANLSRTGVTRMQIIKTLGLGFGAAFIFALTRPTFAADPAPAPLPVERPAKVQSNPTPDAQPDPARQARRTQRAATMAQRSQTRSDDRMHRGAGHGSGAGIGKDKVSVNVDIQTLPDGAIGEKVEAALAHANINQKIAEAHIGEKVDAALLKVDINQKIAQALAQLRADGMDPDAHHANAEPTP